MLRKLMKYEFKATGRLLLPLYLALIVLSIINKFFIGLDSNGKNMNILNGVPAVISMFIYGCILVAMFIVTFFIIAQRYYRNILGDEGYLMNTLPVRPWENIASKLLVGITWIILSGLVAIISIVIMAYYPNMFGDGIEAFRSMFSKGYSEIGGQVNSLMLIIILLAIISLVSSIMQIYASISIGNIFEKRKILFSFGAFLGLKIITGIISTIVELSGGIAKYNTEITLAVTTSLLIKVVLIQLVFITCYFLICNYIIKNKLNLE